MTAARKDPDETKPAPQPNFGPSRRSNSQQPTVRPQPLHEAAAGSNVDSSIPIELSGTHTRRGMLLFDPLLSTLATGLDDVEKVRIAQANRFRILTATAADSDGETRGFGLDLNHPAVAALAAQLESLEAIEKLSTKALTKQLKSHALHPWIKTQCGLGDKQVARLLHSIRDPYWNDLHDRPRTVSELWAFCGLHVLPTGHYAGDTHLSTASGAPSSDTGHMSNDAQLTLAGVAPRRKRGQRHNWSTEAKTRTYLIAEACMKQLRKPCVRDDDTDHAVHVESCACSPYRIVYDLGRIKYADSVHAVQCAPCSALPGAPLKDGHKHARAMRLVMKAVLRDLWIESKRIYETRGDS